MNELDLLRTEFDKFKKNHPKTRGYPKALWQRVVNLSSEYPSGTLGQKLGISANNIRLHMERSKKKTNPHKLVPLALPEIVSSKVSQTLEILLPNGIQIKIYQ